MWVLSASLILTPWQVVQTPPVGMAFIYLKSASLCSHHSSLLTGSPACLRRSKLLRICFSFSAGLFFSLRVLSEVRGIEFDDLCAATSDNFFRLFQKAVDPRRALRD